MAGSFQPDLTTRVFRMLVPASLAGGIVALYPAIADSVVAKFGPGFRPGLVAIYVATLVLLFLADAALRDKRQSWLARVAAQAEKRAEGEMQRSRELCLMLDLASALEGDERLESALLSALERLRVDVPFNFAAVFAAEGDGPGLHRRGICPLTMQLPERLADQLTRLTGEGENGLYRLESQEPTIAVSLRTGGTQIGFLVVEGADVANEVVTRRLRAAADRLAAAMATRRLISDLHSKEKSLRLAWRELRMSGQRVARSTARAETAALAERCGDTLLEPLREARTELRQLRRSLTASDVADPRLDRIEKRLGEIERRTLDLIASSRFDEPTKSIDLNEVVVAAVDLVAPELTRARVEVRMRLDPALDKIVAAEGPLHHVLVRVLRRLRAELRHTPGPRRLEIETAAAGAGARILLKANSAGVTRPDGSRKSIPGEDINFNNAHELQQKPQTAWRVLVRAARLKMRRESRVGDGVAYSLTLNAVKEPGLL